MDLLTRFEKKNIVHLFSAEKIDHVIDIYKPEKLDRDAIVKGKENCEIWNKDSRHARILY